MGRWSSLMAIMHDGIISPVYARLLCEASMPG